MYIFGVQSNAMIYEYKVEKLKQGNYCINYPNT
jgi:hypothetical protein